MWVQGYNKRVDEINKSLYDTLFKNMDKEMEVIVACDSQQYPYHTKMTSIVVVRYFSKGCTFFVKSEKIPRIGRIIPKGEKFGPQDMAFLRLRLLEEASNIIETARFVEPIVRMVEEDHFEKTGRIQMIGFHTEADVHTDAKEVSNAFLKEIVGYIRGCGFEVRAKPDAMMASNAADKFAKK